MLPKRRSALVASAACVALATGLAGCGGGGTTKAAFDKRADKICTTYNAKLNSMTSQLSGSSSATQAVRILDKAVGEAEQGTNKLKSLPRPSAQSGKIGQAVSAEQHLVGDLKSLVTDLKTNNESKARSLVAGITSAKSTVYKDFDAVGAKACGGGSSAS